MSRDIPCLGSSQRLTMSFEPFYLDQDAHESGDNTEERRQSMPVFLITSPISNLWAIAIILTITETK